ncbi:MAG TPA: DEAD/DEAH box helicase [Acidimicrobiia bacterium]
MNEGVVADDKRSSIADVIDAWLDDPEIAPRIVHIERIEGADAVFADIAVGAAVRGRLEAAGVGRLYRHQAEAIAAIRSGKHTVVVAGTASGKSLCYQIPIAEAIEADRQATALAVFPTKALAQDQLGSLLRTGTSNLVAATYDGDTPRDERAWIRRNANVVVTNPDMLHLGMLPHHERWRHFLGQLRYVVVDEIHSFKGIFGSHVGLVLRRLRRLAEKYGATPTFVFASATIGNPAELAGALSGLDVAAVTDDVAPRGAKTYVAWNPPIEDEARGLRGSPLTDATNVFCDLVANDLQTITFSRSRKASELMYRWARDRLDEERRALVAPYRAGYLVDERRRTEEELFSGRLLGVIATNALELGIDVGGLDAAVLTTFPGTISSFRQQAGRAGRSRRESLAVLVAGHDALDQHYMAHPEELFVRPAEAAVVNVTNEQILADHLRCAAYEAPLVPEDAEWFGHDIETIVPDLVRSGDLGLREGRLYWSGGGAPAFDVDLRTSGGPPYEIIDEQSRHIGTIDEARAFTQCHEGAVYLHQGEGYVVEVLDVEVREVRVRRGEVAYFTQPQTAKELTVVAREDSSTIGLVDLGHGRVSVTTEVLGFQRRSLSTGEVLDTNPVDLPPRSFTTQALWLSFPPDLVDQAGVTPAALPGTMHAIEHTAIAMLPLYAICDRWDVGGLSSAFFADLGGPGFYIYDGYPGGAGIAPIAYQRARQHLAATLQALVDCPCSSGCPSCVQSPKCGNYNDPLDKHGAIELLAVALR